MERAKVVFMGTPEFAVPSLKKVVESGFEVPLVVTQPDKPAGRGKRLKPPPVKVVAEELGIPVIQPERIKDNGDLRLILEEVAPDVIVVVAYGKILPKWMLELPSKGCINLHASLLPAYRGASPIQSVLLDGRDITGVTVMKINERLDAGDILAQKEVKILPEDNAQTLHDKLSIVGAELLAETLPGYLKGEISPIPQDDSRATYCKPITKEMGRIDWSLPAEKIVNMVRAFTPWPSAYTFFKNRRVKLTKARAVEGVRGKPGEVINVAGKLVVAAGYGGVLIEKLKPEGKKEISGEEFVRGYRVKTGDKFE